MKIVDNRSGEHQVLFREVVVYPFLEPDDVIQFDGSIAAQARKDFDVNNYGAWDIILRADINLSRMIKPEDADKIIAALEYARQCANVDLLTDASKPLPAQAERDELARKLAAAGALLARTEPLLGNLPQSSNWDDYIPVLEDVKAWITANPQPSPAANSELVAAVTIEEMSSTLLPDGHEVKGLGCFIEHDGQKLLFFESSVVSDLQHDLSVAKDRIAVLEQSEQMLLKRIKKLRSKSELDDGFIDHLTTNNEDTQ